MYRAKNHGYYNVVGLDKTTELHHVLKFLKDNPWMQSVDIKSLRVLDIDYSFVDRQVMCKIKLAFEKDEASHTALIICNPNASVVEGSVITEISYAIADGCFDLKSQKYISEYDLTDVELLLSKLEKFR
jgi:hypothetical protein